ncbi:MAG: glycosyltransferase family 4 protein [Candidatus Thorarchaeota archaeon]
MTVDNPFIHDPRVYNEARSLLKSGHRVTVLAWDNDGKHPAKELKDDIRVVRSSNTRFISMLPYDIFRLHLWWRKGLRDAMRLYRESPFDAIHCHDLASLPIGIGLKKRLHLPLIYDAHEIWGYMVARDLPQSWANYYLWLEKRLVKEVDAIVTVNDPLIDYYYKFTNREIVGVMNCKHLFTREYRKPSNERFTTLYVGSIGKARFLTQLVDVVESIPNIHCIIGGIGHKKDYVEAVKEKCSKSKNSNFIGRVPMEEVLPLTKQADVVICMTDPGDKNNRLASANKQFEAMACGRPIICTRGTYPGTLTEKLECGIVVDYNENSLRKGIIRLMNDESLRERLGRNALKAAMDEYNWPNQEKRLIKLYERLLIDRTR